MGSAIDQYMPRFDVRERHRVTISKSADAVYAAVRSVDLSDSPLISWLFRLRELPGGLSGRRGRRLGLNIDGLLKAGFVLLEERAGDEILLGLVAKPWTPGGGIQRVTPEEFRRLRSPEFAAITWNFRLRSGKTGTGLSTETRVLCPTRRTRMLFRAYWTIVGPFSGLIRREMLRLVKREAES
jgi:hypothetical protein